ncbi:DUF4215 domain-containing protein [Haliangium sp.]|uniref:DUF4215 domain-containing protein n=1 Tax=Haliangium sp. TaxID=2663208 RepID=UPI003D0BCB69
MLRPAKTSLSERPAGALAGATIASLAGATIASLAVAACSMSALPKSECTSDDQCVNAFGSGTLCGPDGYCVRASDRVDADPSAPDARATPDAIPPLGPIALADQCTEPAALPVVALSPQTEVVTAYRADTSELSDDVNLLGACSGDSFGGNDGFFRVTMQQDERWHLYATPSRVGEDADVSLYVLPSCDGAACQPFGFADSCGPGGDEHLTVIPPQAMSVVVGVDSRGDGGLPVNLTVLIPQCGNGVLEHSETCDDGDTSDGDGCDSMCRAELKADTEPATEVEVNEDFASANVVEIPGGAGSRVITGTLDGRCDFDMFAFTVPSGGAIRASVKDANGQACEVGVPSIGLELRDRNGINVLGAGTAPGGDNPCPAIDDGDTFAAGLDAGTYYLRLGTGRDPQNAFAYQLAVEVSGP